MVAMIILIVFPFAMIYSAFSDALSMTIANRVSVMLIAGFLLVAPFIGLTWVEFGLHCLAFFVVLTLTFVLFALGTMGGGDAKLLASTGLWMGFGPALIDYAIYVTLLGGVVTMILIFFRSSMVATALSTVPQMRYLTSEKDIPYGIALGLGGMLAFPQTHAMQWAFEYLVA